MPDDRERSDDELAVTATAPGGEKAPDAAALGDTLGRYRLERELGAGGMGVVHAAFDPDLERRVALKVLRTTDGGGEARQRLLREARALARLTHPNVVTVHEVGSASGRDFVAMELIEGETLADWLKSGRRSTHDILAVFIAAGRGLAAAHAAGLVHRDFKPHNVLRRNDGRIVVTDFGLARGVEVEIGLEKTVQLRGGKPVVENTPSALSGLTQTGSVLGTPAYMAPEQWSGGPIGPPADQFAFCVALWEALVGERPYCGSTLEALRESVERGPEALDTSRLPRRLRAPLMRGLDPDPAKRWPSMDALLALLGRAERRPRNIARSIAAGLVATGAVVYAAVGDDNHKPAAVVRCEPAVLDPAVVWTPAIANEVREKASADAMRAFDAQIASWTKLRQQACAAPAAIQARRLSCLDGVLVRLDAVRKSSLRAPKPAVDDVAEQLIDPAVCSVADPPRLPTKLSDAAIAGLAMAHQHDPAVRFDVDAAIAALAAAGDDACARAMILYARSTLDEGTPAHEAAEEAVQAADVCGDDRMRADALLMQVENMITAFPDPATPKFLAAAESAIHKVEQPDLVARLDLVKAGIAESAGHNDERIRLADHALKSFTDWRPRGRLRAVVSRIRALEGRHEPGDLETARSEAARWRPMAERLGVARILNTLDELDSEAQWALGDVQGARAHYPDLNQRLAAQRTKPLPGTETIEGIVVDARGKPVAGATVAADVALTADSIGLDMPGRNASVRITTTDAAGHFTLDHVMPRAIIVAQLANLRSHARRAKSGDRLVLQPTTTIAGKVIDRTPDQSAVVVLSGERDASTLYQMLTPIRADGTFTLDGVPVGKLRVVALAGNGIMNQSIAFQEVTVGPGGLANLQVQRAEGRKLRVVVRSSAAVALSGAEVFVVSGTISIKNATEIERILTAPGVAVEVARPPAGETTSELHLLPGDLVATVEHAPKGVATACAVGLSGDLTDTKFLEQMEKHREQIEVRCSPAPVDANVVTIEVPPMKRFD